MIKWLKDSYNGIYVILLKPYMPSVKALALLIGGFLLGLVVAYAIYPTIYYNADPSTLEQSWQDEWVRLLADRYATANADISEPTIQLLRSIDDPLGTVDRLLSSTVEQPQIDRLSGLRPLAEAAQQQGAATAPQPNAWASLQPWIIGTLVLLIVSIIVALLYGMFVYPNLVEPLVKRIRGEKVSDEVIKMRQQVATQRAAEATLKTDFTTTTLGAPIFQRMSSYTIGMGEYDYSYSIETATGAFLGECGVTGSETIGSDRDKFTGIEVWLFDKEDFQNTITKVLVSPFAMNDAQLRARLEPKGDLVMAQVGATAVLETATLRLQARIVDVEYGTGALPPNSYFQKITVELAAWKKAGTAAVATPAAPVTIPAAAPVTQVAAPPTQQFAPPPPVPVAPRTQPAAAPPPTMPAPTPSSYQSAPPQPPVNPPPAAPRRFDDDPFGGTGDFTPSG
jgi:hypothetical protein